MPDRREVVHFRDYTNPDPKTNYTCYKLIAGSDDALAFAKLTTDPERLEFMRKHAVDWHDMPFKGADWTGYLDKEAGREYLIRFDSPEGDAFEELAGDYPYDDAERDKEIDRQLLAYAKAHAHVVKDISPLDIELQMGAELPRRKSRL